MRKGTLTRNIGSPRRKTLHLSFFNEICLKNTTREKPCSKRCKNATGASGRVGVITPPRVLQRAPGAVYSGRASGWRRRRCSSPFRRIFAPCILPLKRPPWPCFACSHFVQRCSATNKPQRTSGLQSERGSLKRRRTKPHLWPSPGKVRLSSEAIGRADHASPLAATPSSEAHPTCRLRSAS